ncbi:MAG TPA: FAD-dependent thymidylate synthase [Bacillota bacterium]|jgi:thymidylate synthase (FAD)
MKVILMSHTPDPEQAVALAARLCYSPVGVEELGRAMSREDMARLIRGVVRMGHHSTLEHAAFQFAVEGVSRALTHQLVRHRLASYSQQSQRYVAASGFTYVVPPSVKAETKALETFERVIAEISRAYDDLLSLGLPKEDARYLLPNAAETKIVISMNARALRHFFELRCCARAQWEIRRLAYRMLREARRVAPLLFEDAGPPCESSGTCREGKLSCGRVGRLNRLASRLNGPRSGMPEAGRGQS